MKKFFCSAIALFMLVGAFAADSDFVRARTLYEKGLYAQAMDILQSLPQYGKDAMVDGYVVLCAQKQHTPGYEKLIEGYYLNYSSCSLCTDVRKEQAFDLFDQGDYDGALTIMKRLSLNDFEKKMRPEFVFKRGYCQYKLGSEPGAMSDFERVDRMMMNDYSAPAQYMLGYIYYGYAEFDRALEYFEKSARDERFVQISNYYIINCHYEKDDYGYVITKGVEMFENDRTPAERKAHLARIISESYLVMDDKSMARKFYDDAQDGSEKSRADYFYAGSLLYATGEYQGAVDNYSKMVDKTDSLGQIAWYQTALSYLGLKNKVAALDSFRYASELAYDRKMTEDAHFNYAKLAFDLNGDTSIFGSYLRKYSDKVRGEKIYSYMALAALSDKDYQGAIEFYDKIDVLEGQDKNNYVHANYLRGVELLENGSYRGAVPYMKAVTYYTGKSDVVNQLSRYGLAESYYRNGQYADACSQYTDLYNNSALYGLAEGNALAYDVAYSYLKQNDYASASRWFTVYMNDGGKAFYKDAMLRVADCDFARKEYASAADRYQSYVDRFYDLNDVYPYYQAAMCIGLSIDPSPKKKSDAAKKIARKVEILTKVRDAEPSVKYYPEAMLELGRTLNEQKRNADALAVFEELVRRAPAGPSVAQGMLEIGTLKRNAGDVDGALAAYKSVVETMQASGLADDALLAIESIYQSQNAPQKYIAYIDSIGKGGTKSDAEKEDMYFNAAEQIYFSDSYLRAISAFGEFMQAYPQSEKVPDAWYYIGESHRLLNDKEQACDAYAKVVDTEFRYRENAVRRYAELNYSMENFDKAYDAYVKLIALVGNDSSRLIQAGAGAMRSAYRSKNYENAAQAAASVLSIAGVDSALVAESTMIKAKSLLAMSRRDDAFALLAELAGNPKSEEGAEAAYMLIVDAYDRADFDAVKEKVYAFSDSGTTRQYYLAKAFIVLGDSFAEQGKLKQAEATFRSIADGYKDNAEINEELQVRLQKLEEVKK